MITAPLDSSEANLFFFGAYTVPIFVKCVLGNVWLKPLILLASPTGFEPVTPRLGIWCSILLSYEDMPIH